MTNIDTIAARNKHIQDLEDELRRRQEIIDDARILLDDRLHRAEAAEARVAELERQNIELEEKARVATGQSVALVKRTEAKLARADRLAEEAQECIEERESYWGSQEGMHRHNPEYERLERALTAYRSPEEES